MYDKETLEEAMNAIKEEMFNDVFDSLSKDIYNNDPNNDSSE